MRQRLVGTLESDKGEAEDVVEFYGSLWKPREGEEKDGNVR